MKNIIKNSLKKVRDRFKKTLKNRTLRIIFWTILTQYTLTLLLRHSSLNQKLSRRPDGRPGPSGILVGRPGASSNPGGPSFFCDNGNPISCAIGYPIRWATKSLFGWLWPFGKKDEIQDKKKADSDSDSNSDSDSDSDSD